MAFIESHQSLANHPKTLRLAKTLGTSLPESIGYLHLLWYWAMDYAEDGNIAPYVDMLAEICHYPGDSDALASCLQTARFVDEDLMIHDWAVYAGKLIERRRRDRERKREIFHGNSAGTPQELAKIPSVTNQPTVNQPTNLCVAPLKEVGAKELSLEDEPLWYATLKELPNFKRPLADCLKYLALKGISEERAEETALALKAKWGSKGWKYSDVWATFQVWAKMPPLGGTNAGPKNNPGKSGEFEEAAAQYNETQT